MKPYFLFFLGGVAVLIASFAGSIFNTDQVATAAPANCSEARSESFNAEKAALLQHMAELEKRNFHEDAIRATVSSFAFYKNELKRAKSLPTPTDADSAAGITQYLYRLDDQLENVLKDVQTNQLKENEIGFTQSDVRLVQKRALMETLRSIRVIKRFGTTNRCIYEGGCFGSKSEIDSTIKGVRQDLQHLAKR